MIELYLSKGGDLNVIDNKKWNALHYSAYHGYLEITKYLISIGIDFKAKDKNGRTALDFAKERKKTEIIEFLEEVGKKYSNHPIIFIFY